jgi:hypothetical protein
VATQPRHLKPDHPNTMDQNDCFAHAVTPY